MVDEKIQDAYRRGFAHGLANDYARAHEIALEWACKAERTKVLAEFRKFCEPDPSENWEDWKSWVLALVERLERE